MYDRPAYRGAAADKWRPMQMLQWIFIGITVFAIIITLTFSNQSLFIFGIVGAGLIAGFGNGVIFKMVPYVSKGNTGQ
ncbi:nitrite extrusion protein [Lactiplantibacillus plantarum]|nr:nitrite extrusion protein [Lactiplantibacillus plantarum]